MSPALSRPVFDFSGFHKLAKNDFFTPASQPQILSTRYQSLGRNGYELGFGVSCVAHQIGVELLWHFGSESQKQKYLAQLQTGAWMSAVANTEGTGGTDIRSMKSRVQILPEGARLTTHKNCFTNGPADLAFISAWVEDNGAKPRLEVFMVEGGGLEQVDKRFDLPGFRSGRTGQLTATALPIDVPATQLGRDGQGFEILKFCFDLERLMISALIQGALVRAEKNVLDQLSGRGSMGRQLIEHQWVQDKVIDLRKVSENLRGLLSLCQADFESSHKSLPQGLRSCNGTLSLLKWQAVDDGIQAVTAALEAAGVRGLQNDGPHFELLTDLFHLKFLGGTRELQKSFLFQDIIQSHEVQRHEQVRSTQKAG